MKQKVESYIAKKLPFIKGKKLLIAVSGGIDSMVATSVLKELQFDIAVAHCNFQLRDSESNDDQMFIVEYCKTHKIPYFTINFETNKFAIENKLSIQLAARKLRYDWFYKILKEQNFDFIVTAHHLNDQLETFLINLSRGTGLEGLIGIPVVNDKIVRPFLDVSRKEIEIYAIENKIKWREDSSNASEKYVRNKIRHQITPILEDLNPHFFDTFLNTLNHLNQAKCSNDNFIKEKFKKIVSKKNNDYFIDISLLKEELNYQFLLFNWLKEFGFQNWNDVYHLIDSQSGKMIKTESNILYKDRNNLVLKSIFNTEESDLDEIKIINLLEIDNLPLKFEECNQCYTAPKNKNVIFVDAQKIKFPLTLRKWKEGDFFYPLGMNGKKKLSKYFKDEKIPVFEKDKIWILTSENEIVWVVGHRMDNRFRTDSTTQKIIKIEFKP